MHHAFFLTLRRYSVSQTNMNTAIHEMPRLKLGNVGYWLVSPPPYQTILVHFSKCIFLRNKTGDLRMINFKISIEINLRSRKEVLVIEINLVSIRMFFFIFSFQFTVTYYRLDRNWVSIDVNVLGIECQLISIHLRVVSHSCANDFNWFHSIINWLVNGVYFFIEKICAQ